MLICCPTKKYYSYFCWAFSASVGVSRTLLFVCVQGFSSSNLWLFDCIFILRNLLCMCSCDGYWQNDFMRPTWLMSSSITRRAAFFFFLFLKLYYNISNYFAIANNNNLTSLCLAWPWIMFSNIFSDSDKYSFLL